jgi:hypothetical protein
VNLPRPDDPNYLSAIAAALGRDLTPHGNVATGEDFTRQDLPVLIPGANPEHKAYDDISAEELTAWRISTYIDCILDECDATDQIRLYPGGLIFIRSFLRRSSFSYDNASPCLINCDLTDATFANATEISPVFIGCNLTRVDFSYANLAHPTFIDCGLDDAIFRRASVHSPLFIRSDLSVARLRGATFTKPYDLPPGYRFEGVADTTTRDDVIIDVEYLESKATSLKVRPGVISSLITEHPDLSPTKALALALAVPSPQRSQVGVC